MAKKHIVLVISGGIACFKACQLCSDLSKKYEVQVILTKHAAEFVSPVTFATLTKRPCLIDMFSAETDYTKVIHIELAKWADLVVVAPATANILAKMANGIADDLASTTLLAARSKILVCPAMNSFMLDNLATQANIATLCKRGIEVMQAETGFLACGDIGRGKLPVPSEIEAKIANLLLESQTLKGLKIIVTAGPTVEAIDPVRYITNHSSGKMGYAIAKVAAIKGADVTLISGPVNLETPVNVNVVQVKTALDMLEAVKANWSDHDMLIMAAAVADYRLNKVANQKIKKSEASLQLELVKNPDILQWAGEHKQAKQVLCGFAMETEHLLENAKNKLLAKNCDLLVANDLTTKGAGFAGDTNVATLLWPDKQESLALMSKTDLASKLLSVCHELYQTKNK
ncbi:bifunctional phosphopantothenoylcysteine decarboxylase/phosphopantothenate--cysteine ligase CoaBC [Amygdalobacter nucleatus]|nr:bifunctional phosphopantothenoylcysteine decarboxylase/phosphopantothenate--cysteine ligase CoaBC [Amygdalobacter nucleatus]MDF0485650.1 bifunctional phosphopantothenoylcysteine decarboxylase/phosphopantothenate--cysteine ligase CoaBC [Amygdalobacter nucleatus]